ncbi:MAG: CopG family transcriptional regulator [Candidatus Nanohaloarchaea archaeon]|nr:CopG family transcriptional regulator [Candidatus Nanohaloarchaea archaeon]
MPEIDIPDEHYETFKERAPEKGFDTAEDYVRYVLEQVYEKLQEKEDGDETSYTEEEEEKVKERLRGLGYLD